MRQQASSLYAHWIVSRALCLYRRVDFGNVPRNRRRAAVELKLPVWSPFTRTGCHCVWSGGVAMIWLWDEDVVGPAESEGESRAALRIRPETVFYPRKADGIHIQACGEGFELQHWRDAVLEDSLWLLARPNSEQIETFRSRSGNAEPDDEELVPTAANLAAEPWSSRPSPVEWLRDNERRLVLIGLVAAALATSWQEARIWKVLFRHKENVDRLALMQDRLAPFLDTRDQVRKLSRRNKLLADLHATPSQAYVMGRISEAIPDDAARFREWLYQQGELRLVIEGPNIDPVAYVDALERLFDGVELGRAQQPGRIELLLRVDGERA